MSPSHIQIILDRFDELKDWLHERFAEQEKRCNDLRSGCSAELHNRITAIERDVAKEKGIRQGQEAAAPARASRETFFARNWWKLLAGAWLAGVASDKFIPVLMKALEKALR